MSLIALASAKASPGVTTAVVALASTWPAHRTVLVAELDPAGGDLGARFDLASQPGLVSLAAASRHGLDEPALRSHIQDLGFGVEALVGPGGAEQAHAALASLGPRMGTALAEMEGIDVLADCGRLDPTSPLLRILRPASRVVMVARPTVEEMRHLRPRLASLQAEGRPVGLVLVGQRPYSPEEVAQALEAEVWGVIAHDRHAAAALNGSAVRSRGLRRSLLLRSAREVAEALAPRAPAMPGDVPAETQPGTRTAWSPPQTQTSAEVSR